MKPSEAALMGLGYALRPVKALERRVWLERETFHGGVNLSARARNRERRAEADKVFVDHVRQAIYGSPSVLSRLMMALENDK